MKIDEVQASNKQGVLYGRRPSIIPLYCSFQTVLVWAWATSPPSVPEIQANEQKGHFPRHHASWSLIAKPWCKQTRHRWKCPAAFWKMLSNQIHPCMPRLWFVDQLCETLNGERPSGSYEKQQNTNKKQHATLPVCSKRRNFKYRCAIRAWDASISAMATNLWSLFWRWVKCAEGFLNCTWNIVK